MSDIALVRDTDARHPATGPHLLHGSPSPGALESDTFGATFESHLAALECLARIDLAQCDGRFERQLPVLVPYDFSPPTRLRLRLPCDGRRQSPHLEPR